MTWVSRRGGAWIALAGTLCLGASNGQAAPLPGAAARVLTLVNQERARAGGAPLAASPALDAAALDFSEAMAAEDFYAHLGPDGSTPLGRMNAAGFPGTGAWGENIAVYYRDPEAVVRVWMDSPGHRANILNPAFTHMGIGAAVNPTSRWGYYWTLDFGVLAAGAAEAALPRPAPPLPPVLTGLSLVQGMTGDTVALVGQRFGTRAGAVSFGGLPARLVSWGDTRVEVLVPNGAASGLVALQNALGVSGSVWFTVVPPPAPAPAAQLSFPVRVLLGSTPRRAAPGGGWGLRYRRY